MYLPDNTIHVNNVKCPILLIHSRDDTLIPISQTERIKAINPINVTLIKGAGGHNFNVGNHILEIKEHLQSLN